MDDEAIRELLPHREPFLLVHRVETIEPGERAVGIHEVGTSEFWVPGHFPTDPVMPGVLITEALAQVAAIVYLAAHRERAGQAIYLVGLDDVRFRRPVRPGDTLRLEVEVEEKNRRMWTFRGTATVDGQRAATGRLRATFAQQ